MIDHLQRIHGVSLGLSLLLRMGATTRQDSPPKQQNVRGVVIQRRRGCSCESLGQVSGHLAVTFAAKNFAVSVQELAIGGYESRERQLW